MVCIRVKTVAFIRLSRAFQASNLSIVGLLSDQEAPTAKR
jgi:hypothetical protein